MEMKLSVDEIAFYHECGEYFDTHDLSEMMKDDPEVHFEISPGAQSHFYYEVERDLREQLRAVAHARGVSPESLLNQWLREKLAETHAVDAAE